MCMKFSSLKTNSPAKYTIHIIVTWVAHACIMYAAMGEDKQQCIKFHNQYRSTRKIGNSLFAGLSDFQHQTLPWIS